MNKPFRLLVGIISTVFTLAALVVGIMLTNTVTLTFWQMICYDLIFVLQFLTFLWSAVVFTKAANCNSED